LAAARLAANGVDFLWQASHGSTTLAHFMQAGCFQGQAIVIVSSMAAIGFAGVLHDD
jgi:hypothetical protein